MGDLQCHMVSSESLKELEKNGKDGEGKVAYQKTVLEFKLSQDQTVLLLGLVQGL